MIFEPGREPGPPTRVGCVVLLVLVGGLVALLVPAVQKVRAAAARAACQCRHCQIGLALHTYADNNQGQLPAGTVPQPMPAEERLSWVADILPYMNGEDIAAKLDRTAGHAAPSNAEATSQQLRWALCPAAPQTAEPLTHSVGVAGVGTDAATLPAGHLRAGVFGYDRRTAFNENGVPDGLSNTLLVIETGTAPGRWAAGGPATVRGIDPADTPLVGPGRPFAGFHPDSSYNPFAPPRYAIVVVMADGHTRTLTSAVSPAVLAALATVAGGESLPPE